MRDIFTGLAFVVAGIVTILTAQQFPTLPSLQYGPSLFPSIVGAGFCLGGALLTASALLHRQQMATQTVPSSVEKKAKPNLLVLLPPLAIVFYIVASDYVGALITMAIIMFGLMMLRKTSPWIALAVSLLVAFAIYFIFSRYLLIPLPQGVLLEGHMPWI